MSSDLLKGTGVVVSGLVSEVRPWVKKDTGEERWSLQLFIPGSIIIQVGLKGKPPAGAYEAGTVAKLRVSVGSYQGKMFFNEL